MSTIDVCLSPDLIHQFNLKSKTAVVVDILRATSCMVSGIANGARAIKPFMDKEACAAMAKAGWLTAGERNGVKIEGFDLGNSPFDYLQATIKGQQIAVTTTNGTVAIEKSKTAAEIIIGAFLNISSTASYLLSQQRDVIIVCAGWKGKVNMEDSLFAGALIQKLRPHFEFACDCPRLIEAAYSKTESNLLQQVNNSSHAKRLKRLNIDKDVEFCMQHDMFDVVPVIKDGLIVKA